jgi:hypothetical protein
MDDKITIIEGPPPVFEKFHDGWAVGLNECTDLSSVVLTRLRTFNAAALVERCHRTWRSLGSMHLEYRATDGLPRQSPIVAIRPVEVDDGDMVLLWVRLVGDEMRMVLGHDDDQEDGEDDGGLAP